MKRRVVLFLGATLAIGLGLGSDARADSYAFSRQQISNFSVAPPGGAIITPVTPRTRNSAIINGGNPSGSELQQLPVADALQAYVGPGTRPAENTFTPPRGQTGPDYARGDSRVISPGLQINTVAETFLRTVNAVSAADGSYTVSSTITTTAANTALTLRFDFDNQATVQVTAPGGTASAAFTTVFTVRNEAGQEIFRIAPEQVNAALSLNQIGGPVTVGGMGTVTPIMFTLPVAGVYTATLSGQSEVFATVVPEPSSLVMAGAGLVGLVGLGLRRRRALAR